MVKGQGWWQLHRKKGCSSSFPCDEYSRYCVLLSRNSWPDLTSLTLDRGLSRNKTLLFFCLRLMIVVFTFGHELSVSVSYLVCIIRSAHAKQSAICTTQTKNWRVQWNKIRKKKNAIHSFVSQKRNDYEERKLEEKITFRRSYFNIPLLGILWKQVREVG